MNLQRFFEETDLNNSFIIGYYGGGNYGDELLLEVLQGMMKKYDYKNIKYYYTDGSLHSVYHKDIGYKNVNPNNKFNFIKELLSSKNIIIGGGGLWGLDFNRNMFILSIILFVLRYILFKKVYILGIGYYSSTSKEGHKSAYLAGKSANIIIARDQESFDNFNKINSNTFQDLDISFSIPDLEKMDYSKDIKKLESIINPDKKTYIISLRRFKKSLKNNYTDIIQNIIKKNQDKKFVVNIFEPKKVDPEGYKFLEDLKKEHSNVYSIFDFSFNPLSYYYFLKKYKDSIITIAPQFHSIITAYQAGAKFLPIVYDNKVEEVLKQMKISQYKWIGNASEDFFQEFIDKN